ncbi:heavy-metal-associated domain-containing protein [Streptomyces abikoensis]|uniref:heavy-metal-associated domain-containing protein n=1 Tax=Streptomyces abikoensis TaxID=97398 RepID=UPI00367D97A2
MIQASAEALRSPLPRSTPMSTTTVYKVSGMTCGHCESAVREEVSALAGVSSVEAVAATGLVTITAAGPLDDEAVRAAVDEAGYELSGRA